MNKYFVSLVRFVVPEKIRQRLWKIYYRKQDKKVLRAYTAFCKKNTAFFTLKPWNETYVFFKNKVINGIQYYSQFYQDYYLDTFIFNKKENGFFLDIGGNDPVRINNTYFFEKERSWTGLAFEPMPAMNKKWKEMRKVECMQIALGSSISEMEFCEYEDDYMSGFSDSVDYTGKVKSKYKVNVFPLEKVLKEKSISHIDFVSMDIEGSELEALNGIDFDSVTIDYFVIENNKGVKKERSIRNFLLKQNYVPIARLYCDDIWKRKDTK